MEGTLSAVSDFGCRDLENMLRNLFAGKQFVEAARLWGAFTKVPAVICGSGPSLSSQIPLLGKIGQRALIFAAGSAAHRLEACGVQPHALAALDPHLPLNTPSPYVGSGACFFYQWQLSSEGKNRVNGLPIATLGYGASKLQQWLLEKLAIDPTPFEVGWNAATFAAQIAYHLGCSPIVFVGIDHCEPDERGGALACTDTAGFSAWSRHDLLLGKKWLEELAVRSSDAVWLDASEGGLGLATVPYVPLAHVIRDFFQKEQDLTGRLYSAVERASPKRIEHKQVRTYLQKIQQSVERSKKHCEIFLRGLQEKQARPLAEIAAVELEEELFWGKRFASHVGDLARPSLLPGEGDFASCSAGKSAKISVLASDLLRLSRSFCKTGGLKRMCARDCLPI